MADRPILFSAPMVRALLDGTKTQTRRMIKPRGKRPSLFNGEWTDGYVLDPGNESWRQQDIPIKLGDRLWVKETWAPLTSLTHNDPGPQAIIDGGFYRADNGTVDGEVSKWKPSIFMPRHASRTTLKVADVRVERLQDISEADALSEGILQHRLADWAANGTYVGEGNKPVLMSTDHPSSVYSAYSEEEADCWWNTAAEAYAELWNHINGAGAWESNPWVVAYTFDVIKQNIDQIEQVAA